MSYGSHSYSSTSYAGLPVSRGSLFLWSETLAQGVHRRSLEYLGAATFFQIETQMQDEPQEVQRIVRIYSHNDPGETPQLQVTTGGDAYYSQSIIGAARFIVVELEFLITASQIGITISGSEYFQ